MLHEPDDNVIGFSFSGVLLVQNNNRPINAKVETRKVLHARGYVQKEFWFILDMHLKSRKEQFAFLQGDLVLETDTLQAKVIVEPLA